MRSGEGKASLEVLREKTNDLKQSYKSLYFVDRASFSNSFYFFTNLIHLVFFTILVYLSLHVSDQSVHQSNVYESNTKSMSLTPTATHDRSTTEGTTPEAVCVIKHLILLMMDRLVRNM